MFEDFFRRRKIQKYATQLPYYLVKKYGKRRYYSKAQVDTALARKRIPVNNNSPIDNCYAYAMYCSPNVFEYIHEQAEEQCDYGVMRGEISNTLFPGTSSFTFSTLLEEAIQLESSSNTSSCNENIYCGDDGFGEGGDDGGGSE